MDKNDFINETFKNNPWIQTFTGRVMELSNPKVSDIDLIDIAHTISNQCRFGGHVTKFYSVAQHSVLVSRNVSKKNKLWGLLHDASEAYIVDIPSPLKNYLSTNYKTIEDLYMKVICKYFGLPEEMPDEVKIYDKILLLTERRDLLIEQKIDWGIDLPVLSEKIIPWSPEESMSNFLAEYYLISGDIS